MEEIIKEQQDIIKLLRNRVEVHEKKIEVLKGAVKLRDDKMREWGTKL